MKVLIVDNHELILESIEAIIMVKYPKCWVKKVMNGKEALEEAKRFIPDCIISDYKMEGLTGLELLSELKIASISTRFLVISMIQEMAVIRAFMDNGVSGYISKDAEKREIQRGIYTVLEGGQFFCSLTKELINADKGRVTSAPFFSKRELEVMKLIYAEQKNQEIASRLNISVSTVETHKKNILKKLNVKSTVGLIKYIVQENLFSKEG
jgi:DNA-binding NarL/FixJ family response regulator